MEIRGADGPTSKIKSGSKTVFGRASGLSTSDRTVSRRHVLFELKHPAEKGEAQTESTVLFQVIGKNPIWVCGRTSEDIKVFRKSEGSDLRDGDQFCVSGQNPVWFVLKRSERHKIGNEEERDSDDESEVESVNIEDIDPIKEFGFLMLGHEFDQYPRQRIRHPKDWDWFLEEPGKHSEDEDASGDRGRKSVRRKKRKAKDNDEDEEWISGSENDNELIAMGRKVQRPTYFTRSKDGDKSTNGFRKNRSPVQKEDGSDNEDDETLGGFIVSDDEDDREVEEESDVDEEEEAEDFDDEEED